MKAVIKTFALLIMLTPVTPFAKTLEQDKNESINNSVIENKQWKELKEQLIGNWILDKEASLEFAKNQNVPERIAKILPKILDMHGDFINQVSEHALIIKANDKQMTFELDYLNSIDDDHLFTIKASGKTDNLTIKVTKKDQLNLTSSGLVGYELLVWKKKSSYKHL